MTTGGLWNQHYQVYAHLLKEWGHTWLLSLGEPLDNILQPPHQTSGSGPRTFPVCCVLPYGSGTRENGPSTWLYQSWSKKELIALSTEVAAVVWQPCSWPRCKPWAAFAPDVNSQWKKCRSPVHAAGLRSILGVPELEAFSASLSSFTESIGNRKAIALYNFFSSTKKEGKADVRTGDCLRFRIVGQVGLVLSGWSTLVASMGV